MGVGAQPVGALLDDANRLAHFRHAAEITIVAIAVHAHGNIKIHFVIHFIGLFFAHIPFHARAAQHHAREAFLQRAFRRHHANAHGTLLPNAVVGEQRFQRIYIFGEAFAKCVNKIQHTAFARGVEFF